MTNGVLIFAGMQVGVLSGDLKIEINPAGASGSAFILSTAYNVLLVWLRIAHDQLLQAKRRIGGNSH